MNLTQGDVEEGRAGARPRGDTSRVPPPALRVSWATVDLRGPMPWLSTAFAALAALGVAALLGSCTTVDPGPNFVVADETFDADFFFCHVEPELIFGKKCGPGDPGAGDQANSCHFNASAVSGMALLNHAPVDCGGGDRPVNRAQVGAGGPAQGNLQSVSLVMSRDYLTAPVYVRPIGNSHPRAIFPGNDPVVDVLRRWAQK